MLEKKYYEEPCKSGANDVSLAYGETYLDKGIDAQVTDAMLRTIKTRNGCTATLIFSQEEDPTIRRDVAEMLLRSLEKRSEAS